MKFIIWDNRDHYRPRQDDDGAITSDGLLGRLDKDNVYIRTYAQYPEGSKRVTELSVGESISGVKFQLAGQTGVYDIYRVE